MKTVLYHVTKATEGGKGKRQSLLELKYAGIKARDAGSSCYVGLTCLEVDGNKRIQKKASKILFGGAWR